MNIYKWWEKILVQPRTKPGNKAGLFVNGILVKPRGLARRLQQERLDIAIRNANTPHFNDKYA